MNKPINLADLSNSPYLVSDNYTVGTVLPPAVIERIVMEQVPVPNSTKKNAKAVVYFQRATKGWCMNTTVARQIAKAAEVPTKGIEREWVGVTVQLVVVGNVRRPDGTFGNAFRLQGAWGVGKAPVRATPAASIDPATVPPADAPATTTPPADGAAP